jgi:hypothetical protein
MPAMTREELIEKILKVEALFAGTDSAGEKQAAGSALDRLKAQLAAVPEPLTEFKVVINDPWKRQLFVALCRRNGIHPYRLPRQRHGTVMLRTTRPMLDQILWPQFLELSKLLHSYLEEATRDIIARSVHGDLSEEPERPGLA